MSNSRFLQSFILALILPLLTCAAASSGERMRLSLALSAHDDMPDTKKLSKPPGAPPKSEKFISKRVEPNRTDVIESNTEGKPDAARPLNNASQPGNNPGVAAARPLFSGSMRQLTLIDKTYLDAYTILQENNPCSQFFGGPRVATVVLNSLHPRLETSLIENHVGITMFGSTTFITDFQSGASYRLFNKALVNLRGPFYRSVNYQSQKFFHQIGSYLANTREARVLMLLHELGHLLRGADGNWLLPDDGDSPVQVAANTIKIMARCGRQITTLRSQRAP